MADIRKRNDGKKPYQVRYLDSSTKTGYGYKSFARWKDAVTFRSQKELEEGGALQQTHIRTINQAIDEWLDICEKEGRHGRDAVSAATQEQYEYRARVMKAYSWNVAVQDLREAHGIEFRSWLLRNFSRDKAQKVLSSFHSVLIEMAARRVIREDPIQNVTISIDSRYREPVRIPTIEEFREILRASDRLANSRNYEIAKAWERYRPMIYLAADTGMRPQEYLVMPVAAVQETGVRVTQALDRSNNIGPPKTKAGRRFIPVSEGTLDMALHYARKQESDDLLFPARRKGEYQRYNNYLRRGWHKLMDEAGLVESSVDKGNETTKRKYTPYALRHFYASTLIENNRSLKYVQTVMGHEDIEMTLNVYTHVIQEREALASSEAGGILSAILEKPCGEFVAGAL